MKLSLTLCILFLVQFRLVIFAQSSLSDVSYVSGFTKPVGFTSDPSGRIFVWELGGKVWSVTQNGVKASTPCLDLNLEVFDYKQLGLMSVLLDPNFMTNGYIYLYYSVDLHWEVNFGHSGYNPALLDGGNGWEPRVTFGRLTRYTLTNLNSTHPTLVPNSRTVLLAPTRFGAFAITAYCHAGGGMSFGHDGSLLLALGSGAGDGANEDGDGGYNSWTDWQGAINYGIMTAADNVGDLRILNLDNYAGKVLRINPTNGTGYPSNPYYQSNNPSSVRSKIWCYGFRNPFRMTMIDDESGSHHTTDGNPGKFLISDVGSNLKEELNLMDTHSKFFGWPKWEGANHLHTWSGLATIVVPEPHQKPLVDYRDSQGRAFHWSMNMLMTLPGSVISGDACIGGLYFEGEGLPEQYHGKIIMADYTSRNFYSITVDHHTYEAQSIEVMFQSPDKVGYFDTHPVLPGLFYISGAGETGGGELRRIIESSDNLPIAKIESSNLVGYSPLLINFSAKNSISKIPGNLTFHWNFGNGLTRSDAHPSVLFGNNTKVVQQLNVTLTVTDVSGNTAKDSVIVKLNTPKPVIDSTSIDDILLQQFNLPLALNLSAYARNLDEPIQSSLTYTWEIVNAHNGHQHVLSVLHGNNLTHTLSSVDCEVAGATYWHRIYLTVTNMYGESTVTYRDIFPLCGSVNTQTITFPPIANQMLGTTSVTLSATSSSGLPIQYYVVSGPAVMLGNQVLLTPNKTGKVVIRATQNGSTGPISYDPARPQEQSFIVNKPVSDYPCSQPQTLQYFEGNNGVGTVLQNTSSDITTNYQLVVGGSTSNITIEGKSILLKPGSEIISTNQSIYITPKGCDN